MSPRNRTFLIASAALAAGAFVLAGQGLTRIGALTLLDRAVDATQAQQDMIAARREGEAARRRAEALEQKARGASERVEKTAREAAAVAARIQETEAGIAAQQARLRLIASERAALRQRLAVRQAPLARLTGSLQLLSRRPPILAMLRPGSVRDTVYLRALLDTMLPQVQRRTAGLRAEIERGRALETQALAARADLAATEIQMRERRSRLAVLETRQRLASRQASGIAAREAEHALALAETARDLGDLVDEMGLQGALREQLSALPGPVMRPDRPEDARILEASRFDAPPEGLASYMLPVTGRIVTGFGEVLPGQAASRGLTLATRAHAQAVSPAPGRIAYAGSYSGFGRIVIIEHDGGWTSLVTGLSRLDVAVGDSVVSGSPLGETGPGDPRVQVELRKAGVPVNPLQYVRSL